jgi:allophanate hydrolase subunit 2
LTITRRLAGRRVHRRCVAPTRHNRAKQKCTRSIAVRGAITLTGKAGSNSYAFKGRIGGHKLGPGSYVLKLTPAGGTSRTATLRITG